MTVSEGLRKLTDEQKILLLDTWCEEIERNEFVHGVSDKGLLLGAEISKDGFFILSRALAKIFEDEGPDLSQKKPADGESYWCVSSVGDALKFVWWNSQYDNMAWVNGSVFASREAAEAASKLTRVLNRVCDMAGKLGWQKLSAGDLYRALMTYFEGQELLDLGDMAKVREQLEKEGAL